MSTDELNRLLGQPGLGSSLGQQLQVIPGGLLGTQYRADDHFRQAIIEQRRQFEMNHGTDNCAYRASKKENSVKTIREELQIETDEWLKDIK